MIYKYFEKFIELIKISISIAAAEKIRRGYSYGNKCVL